MQVPDVRLRQLALRCIKGQSSAREGASLEPALLGAVSQSEFQTLNTQMEGTMIRKNLVVTLTKKEVDSPEPIAIKVKVKIEGEKGDICYTINYPKS